MSITFNGSALSFCPVKTEPIVKPSDIHLSKGWDDIRALHIVQKQDEMVKPPKISFPRILFHRLKKEQIQHINETRQLPQNAKIKDNEINGKPQLTWNIADITAGTHKLPEGYELKNDILGFTHVVREGTQSIFMRKN